MADTVKKYTIKQKDSSGNLVEIYPQILLNSVILENNDEVLSPTEVLKLNSLEEGAEVNNVTSISVNGVACSISNGVVTLPSLATFGSDGKLTQSQVPVGYVDEIKYVADTTALAKITPQTEVIYCLGSYGSDEDIQDDVLLRYAPNATTGLIKCTSGGYYVAIAQGLVLGTTTTTAYSYFNGAANRTALEAQQKLYNSYSKAFNDLKADCDTLSTNLSKIYTEAANPTAVALATTAGKLTAKTTLKIDGDLTGSISFDGSEHASSVTSAGITAYLNLKSDRITAGTYCSVEVTKQGFVSKGKH